MKKATIILMVITIASKVLGFFRDVVLSYYYGTSGVSDAYLVSQQIPMSVLEFIGLGLLAGFVPLYNVVNEKYGSEESNLFTSKVVNLIAVISVLLMGIGWVFAKPIVKIFAIGFKGQVLDMAVNFTQIGLLSVLFIALGYIFSGYLNIKKRFIIPTTIGFPQNIIIIGSIVLSSQYGLLWLPVGSVLAVAATLMILVFAASRSGFSYKPVLDFKDKYIKELYMLAIPMIVGISVTQVNLLVDKTLASQIAEGGISALSYAFRLNLFVQGVFVLSISTVMYPLISELVVKNRMEDMKRILREVMVVLTLLLVPATVGVIIFAKPIVALLFARGAFDERALLSTSGALLFYAIGMLGMGLREIVVRVFYALQDTKTTMYNATMGMLLNIVLSVTFSRFLGLSGLALGTSLAATFICFMLLRSLHKKIGSFGVKRLLISSGKIVLASLVMGAAALTMYNYAKVMIGSNLALGISVLFGMMVYFALIFLMKIEEFDAMILVLKGKIRRG